MQQKYISVTKNTKSNTESEAWYQNVTELFFKLLIFYKITYTATLSNLRWTNTNKNMFLNLFIIYL